MCIIEMEPRHDGHDGHDGQNKQLTYACITANVALTLLAVVDPLLGRQVDSQAKSFENEGGFTERLYKIRKQTRKNQL